MSSLKAMLFFLNGLWPAISLAQVGVGPQPIGLATEGVPTPRDLAFRGQIDLDVDATDTVHRIYVIHETVPVQKDQALVLLYPQWETGSHAATASVAALAALRIHDGVRTLAWKRDKLNPFAFHVDVPSGTTKVEVDFQFLSPIRAGTATMTPSVISVPWPSLVLYPAGWFARDIPISAHLKLPPNMSATTALSSDLLQSGRDGRLSFAATSLERLTDSPVYAGRFFRREELAPAGAAPVHLDIFAEDASSISGGDIQIENLRRMVAQVGELFGSRPFSHYDMQVILGSSFPGPGGVEHLDSSESVLPADFLNNPRDQLVNADLLAHEFIHAWNGRSRQPADLWTPNLNEPMGDSLLWVYEGLTQYWGRVIAARAGQRSVEEANDQFAIDAAETQGRAGRLWKSLEDSSNDSIYMAGRTVTWRDWTRREDYYIEGPLLWLDVDTRLRELSHEHAGLDDFARAFFGGRDGDAVTRTYTLDDICAALEKIAPADWKRFMRDHLDTHDGQVALQGLTRAGWTLNWEETPSVSFKQNELDVGGADLSWSIGAIVTQTGLVRNVRWDSSAFRAGFNPGDRITAIDGQGYDIEQLTQAIHDSNSRPIRLTLETGHEQRTVELDYRGPLRYPHLTRITPTVDRLTPLLAPLPKRPNN